MSGGSLIGGVVGGVAGFFIGGPMGAVYGAGVGITVGSFLDPMTPDVPSTGTPKPEQAVMKSTVGDPCPDLCGTGKATGHLLSYGKERSVAIYAESKASGGKGGPPEPQPQVTGYDYYMSWQLGICAGPIDTLYAIYRNEDDLLWEGPLNIPASGGKETIVIDGFGTIEFYFGSADQVANSKVGEIIADDTLNSPLRNYCWCFCDDCKIGQYPRTPSLSFVFKKIPTYSWSGQDTIQDYDCNPMHAIYYLLSLCGLPASWLYETGFGNVAYDLAQEYRGISIMLTNQVAALQSVESVNSHIDGILKYDVDGKFHPVLVRDDYDVDTIPVIDEDDMLEEPSLVRPSWINTLNEQKAQYTEIYNVTRTKTFIGTLYYFGRNGYYKDVFSSGGVADQYDAVKVPNIEDWGVIKVDAGLYGVYLFRDNGLVYARGENDSYGQLGLGHKNLFPDWEQPTVGKDVAGYWESFKPSFGYTMGLTASHKLYMAGRNNSDSLYTGTGITQQDYFAQELSLNTWSLYASGYGSGDGHKLGLGSTSFLNDLVSPNFSSNLAGLGAQTDGEMGFDYWGTVNPWKGALDGSLGVIQIYCGNKMSYLATGVDTCFSIYGAGNNTDGRLGIGSFVAQVKAWTLMLGGPWKAFDCGPDFCIGVKTDGTLWGCGDNANYELGQNDIVNRNTMVQIGTANNWVKVQCSSATTYALNSAGEIWCCGQNLNAQAGIAGGGSEIKVLTQEGTGGTWQNMFRYQGGLFLLK
jgi:hypothetical protein